LQIVASSDLGPLGAKDGAPLVYNWVLPSVAPQFLPWLVLLGLLALKPNRHASAWLIWLPVGCALALTLLPLSLPSGADTLLDVLAALVCGLAAVWLLSSYLRASHRLITFLLVLVVLGGFSALAFFSRQSLSLLDLEWLPFAILLGVGVFTSAVALSLCGWFCRRRFQPATLYVWLFASLAALWLMITLPFFGVAFLASGNQSIATDFIIPLACLVGINFALLLPFLILSSASPFYRQRLKSMLRMEPPAAPPTLRPPEPAVALKP
jgi:hypothetical protein